MTRTPSVVEDHAARATSVTVELRPPGQVGVVREPVSDVGAEHGEHPVDDLLRAAGPKIGSGVGAGHMTQCVVTTSLRSVMWSLCRWVRSTASSMERQHTGRRRGACTTPRPASKRKMALPRPHERRRPGPVRVGKRVAGTEQRDVHGSPQMSLASSSRHDVRGTGRALRPSGSARRRRVSAGSRPGRAASRRSVIACTAIGSSRPHTTPSGDGWRSIAPVKRASSARRSSMYRIVRASIL